MSKPLSTVNVLICQIDASGEADLPIDHADLSVITVILNGGHDRVDRIEYFAADPSSSQIPRVVGRQLGNTAHTVIHKTHFHTLCHLLLQNMPDFVPHFSTFDNKVFHEDKMLRLPKLSLQRLKLIFSKRIILKPRIPISRKPRCFPR